MKAFFDTNILVYVVSDDAKKVAANACIQAGGIVSIQVLNEFVHVARRKLRQEWSEIEFGLGRFRIALLDIVPVTLDTHAAALPIARDHGLTIYDALIIAAAIEAGCDTLFSEDMQHGRTFGRLTIRNPFFDPAA